MKKESKPVKKPVIKKPMERGNYMREREEQSRKDLEIALRAIKLRWDGLEDHDKKFSTSGSTFGIYFTSGQLKQLSILADQWSKVVEHLKPKEK